MSKYLVVHKWACPRCACIEAKTPRLAILKFLFRDMRENKKTHGYYYSCSPSITSFSLKSDVKRVLDSKLIYDEILEVVEVKDDVTFLRLEK